MTNYAITEAQCFDFLRAKARELSDKKAGESCSLGLDVLCYSQAISYPPVCSVRVWVKGEPIREAKSIDEAIAAIPSPAELAAQKRVAAIKLLQEAEELRPSDEACWLECIKAKGLATPHEL